MGADYVSGEIIPCSEDKPNVFIEAELDLFRAFLLNFWWPVRGEKMGRRGMNAVTPIVEAKLDPKYVFLVRASVRLWLVDNCEMDLGEAVDGLIADLQRDQLISKIQELPR